MAAYEVDCSLTFFSISATRFSISSTLSINPKTALTTESNLFAMLENSAESSLKQSLSSFLLSIRVEVFGRRNCRQLLFKLI